MTSKTDAPLPNGQKAPAPENARPRKKPEATAPSTPLSLLEAERKAHVEKNRR